MRNVHPMLEKVARAIALGQHRGHEYVDEMWDYWLPEARAAIQALLEPDEGMVEAGRDKAAFWTYIAQNVMQDAYQAMLKPLLGDEG